MTTKTTVRLPRARIPRRAARPRTLFGAAAGTLAAVLLAACGTTSTSSAGSTPGAINTANCPPSATTAISGDTITLGTSGPLSGPYSLVGEATKGLQAYFDTINAQGGVKTAAGVKQIKLDVLDDQYQPSNVQANVHQLVEQDHVAAVAGLVGTPGNVAVAPYLNSSCVPQLWPVASSSQLIQKSEPFTSGTGTYLDMGTAIGNYLKEHDPNATVAVLYQDDEVGQDPLSGLTAATKGTGIHIVSAQSYEATDTDVAAQMTTLSATKAQVFADFSLSTKCTQSLDEMASANWQPTVFTDGSCLGSDVGQATVSPATKVYNLGTLKDVNDPNVANDPDVVAFKKAMSAAGLPANGVTADGWISGELSVETLEAATTLSPVGIAIAADHLPTQAPGLVLPGIEVHTAPGVSAIRTYQMMPWSPATKSFQAGEVVNV